MGVSNYPAALDNFAATSPPNLGDNDATSRKHAARHDDMEAAMEAVQAELGTNPSGAAATVGAAIAGKADSGHSHSGYVAYPAGGSDDDVLTKSGSSAVWKAVSGGGGGGVDATAMHYKGDYMPNAYVVGDAVRYQGDFWVCVQNVSAGAGAPTSPYWERAVDVPDAYTKAESDTRYAAKVHTHAIADVTGLQGDLNTLVANDAAHDTALAYRVKGYTSSNQPASPQVGDLWVDPDDSSIKIWNGSAFANPSNAGGGGTAWAVVSGGTESTITDGGKSYRLYRFDANGSLNCTAAGYAEVLIVGGGWSDGAGFGNGARILAGTWWISAGSHAVVVGPAGSGGNIAATVSSLGPLACGPTSPISSPPDKTGAGGTAADITLGFLSTIDGTARRYAAAKSTGNPGDFSTAGRVYLRVPA